VWWKRFKTKEIVLVLVLFLAAFLRLWRLNQFPAGLNADEAAIGYNAYSLIETGKDEHGDSWPIHFKSFDDYKPGFYFYLVLPLVKLLGLNIWAVRLPSALLGILSVWLVYLLVKAIFKNEIWGLISAFFLAVSPWHLHFSRGGWEANAASFFILAGFYFFAKGLSRPSFFLASVLFFALSLYTYHSARLVVFLLGIGLVFLTRKQLFKQLNWLMKALIFGLILVAPLVIDFLGPAGLSRFAGVGLLADEGPLWRANELRGHHLQTMALPVRLLHNRFLAYGIAFFENWLDHFQGEFLFLSGDVIERNRVPEIGQMYLLDIPLVLLGIYFLLKKRPGWWQAVFLWLAAAPTAAAMTFQAPHALRAHNLVIPLVVISAYGFYQAVIWLKNQLGQKLITTASSLRPRASVCGDKAQLLSKTRAGMRHNEGRRLDKKVRGLLKETLEASGGGFILAGGFLIIILFSWSIFGYLHQYYCHYPQTYPAAWEYGFDQLVDFLKETKGEVNRIYVTDRYDQPYILFLFYLGYPPADFQKEVKLTPRDKFGFSTVRDFSNFHFEAINWQDFKEEKNVLVIGTAEEIPETANIIKTIYFPNHQPAFKIARL
jgi:4-amino-4-deoxy-L-arabinose transferase-like glycosyltransferase